MTRITVLGGSSVSTPGLMLALRELPLEEHVDVVLHGRSEDKLAAVARACRAAAAGSDVGVESSTDLGRALEGADLILNQVRVGGLAARRFDEHFPSTLGLVGEETMGAGGFSNAVRTIPVVLNICNAVRHYAPSATLVNLTNPASIVHQAIARYAALHVISICDIPITLTKWVHRILDAPPGAVEIDYVGMNHVGWVTAARDRRAGGQDRFPEVLERVEEIPALPFEGDWVRALGVLPGPYLRYFYRRQTPAANGRKRTRADELLQIEEEILAAYRQLPGDGGPAEVARVLSKRAPHWYSEIIVPLLAALRGAHPQRLIVQTTNDARVAWLPDYCAIEAPACISRSGVDIQDPPGLPRDCQALLLQNATYEELAVEAIVDRDPGKALRSLTINPLVGTTDAARAVLGAAWGQSS